MVPVKCWQKEELQPQEMLKNVSERLCRIKITHFPTGICVLKIIGSALSPPSHKGTGYMCRRKSFNAAQSETG